MNDSVWETFEGLFKVAHRQGQRLEELETRVVELERRLTERRTLAAVPPPRPIHFGVLISAPGQPHETEPCCAADKEEATIVTSDHSIITCPDCLRVLKIDRASRTQARSRDDQEG
jgi:hypothetical protein